MSTTPSEKLKRLKQQQEMQESVFRPTKFWEHAAAALMTCITKNDIQNFRRDPACLSYFVPTYGHPGIGLPDEIHSEILQIAGRCTEKKHKLILENFLRGHYHALADYKVISSAQDNCNTDLFRNYKESRIGNPTEQFEFDGSMTSRAAQNYMLGLLFLLMHDSQAKFSKVVEIGGGYGAMGELLFKSNLKSQTYVNFDIPPTCVYADFYLKGALPEIYAQEVDDIWEEDRSIDSLKGVFVRPNWDVTKLQGTVDLFVNFHSFQEMEPHVTKRYISELFRWKPEYLLLRNIKEGKQLATASSAGVEKPTTSQDYQDWLLDEYSLIDTNSLIYGFVTADNFHSEISLWRKK